MSNVSALLAEGDAYVQQVAATGKYEPKEGGDGGPSLPPGTHDVRITECKLTEPKDGKVQLQITFENEQGSIREWVQLSGFKTEKGAGFAYARLKGMGYMGRTLGLGESSVREQFIGRSYSIVVESHEYQGKSSWRIKWINAPAFEQPQFGGGLVPAAAAPQFAPAPVPQQQSMPALPAATAVAAAPAVPDANGWVPPANYQTSDSIPF